MDVTQDRKVDDKKFLVKVYLTFLVDRGQIGRRIALHHRHRLVDGAAPVDFIETRVDISQNKEKEVLVLPVEFQQSQQDVEEGIALVQFAMPHFLGMLLLHDSGILCIVSIYADGTIYPYGKFIDKVMLLLSQQVLFLQVDDVLWLAMTEHKLFAIHIFHQDLWQNKDAIFQRRVIVIPHVAYAHLSVRIPKVHDAVQRFPQHLHGILMLFYDNVHKSYSCTSSACSASNGFTSTFSRNFFTLLSSTLPSMR